MIGRPQCDVVVFSESRIGRRSAEVEVDTASLATHGRELEAAAVLRRRCTDWEMALRM